MKFIVSLLFVGVLVPQVAFADIACSLDQRTGDKWFVTRFIIDEKSLPYEISVVYGADEISQSGEDSLEENIQFSNEGAVPFYLLRYPVAPILLSQDYPDSELPDGYIPYHKVVQGRALSYGSVPSGKRGWFQSNQDYATLLRHELEEMTGLVEENEVGDGRPRGANKPKTDFTFPAFYGDKPFTVKGEFVYELNPDYNSHKAWHNYEGCQKSYEENTPSWTFKIKMFLQRILWGIKSAL